jgi:internalin A
VVYAVLSNTREQNQNFQYWLNIIELLGKESPFFIVQNEKDGHAEPLKDISQIQERFPQTFQSVEHVNLKNAATDPRFDALKLKLFDAATQLPHTQKEYLVSFVNVRQQLERLSATAQTISFRAFKQLCKAEGIEDPELMNDYARTFTLLGIALHFEDDVHLSAQVFLRPKWIIDALFAVLYAAIVEQQEGKFSAADAKTIWHAEEYDDMHGVLLQLMVKFHLCYAIPHTQDFIVPQRLPTRAKEDAFVPPPDATHLVYRYKFLPSGLLTQLTCRLHQRIESNKVWNDAVQFRAKNGQGHVFVRENNTDNHLELFGFGTDKADLLNVVVDTIDEIHLNSKFGNLKVEKLVPCPCPTCATKRAQQEDAFFFEYDILIQDLRDGETESDKCKFSRKRFPIRDILKNASIRLVNIDKIRDLLADNKIDDAVKILRRVLPQNDEVIVQSQRFVRLEEQNRLGQLLDGEFNVQWNRIIKDIVAMLRARENEF